MDFKERLRNLRKENHMTQTEVGEVLGYVYTTISNYESGRNQPSINDLIALADCFHVSVDYLLGVTDMRQRYPETDADPILDKLQRAYRKLDSSSQLELGPVLDWLLYKQEARGSHKRYKTLRVAQPPVPGPEKDD